MSAILTTQETVRLCELERIIQKNKDGFVECGLALSEVRDSNMYRATFKTFEEYCQKRWEFSKRQCDRLISAAKVTENLGPIGPKPETESQARPLAKLPAAEQPAAWTKAQEKAKDEGKPLAARHVEAAVEEARWPEVVVVNGVEEKPKDSERISLLKSTWNKASKKEKVAFAAWINKNWKL